MTDNIQEKGFITNIKELDKCLDNSLVLYKEAMNKTAMFVTLSQATDNADDLIVIINHMAEAIGNIAESNIRVAEKLKVMTNGMMKLFELYDEMAK